MWVVLPGAEPTRAKFFRFSMRLMTEDLPTLDRPAKAICGSRSRGKSVVVGGGADKLRVLCRFTRMVMFLPYCLDHGRSASGAASVGVAVSVLSLLGLGQRRMLQGVGQHLVHVLHRDKVQGAAHGLVDLLQVGLVVRGNDDCVDAVAESRHGLLPQAADGQHPAPQGDLTGHGHVTRARGCRCRAETMAVVMVDAGGGAVLGHRALREVDVDVLVPCRNPCRSPAAAARLRI